MAALPTLYPIHQRTLTDCTLCCVAMVLGLDYLMVQTAAKRTRGWENGLNAREMRRLAKRLGHILTTRRVSINTEGWDEETGVLLLKRGADHHAVMLFNGVVYDPSDGVVWQLDAFLGVSHYKPYSLLLP